ncbi:MAG: bacillithiol biosynthesis protein BshC [Planctomycetota bacterium]|jgi:uncharacterized protein YllA (UPF0747 family)
MSVAPELLAAWRAELEAGGCLTDARATGFDLLARPNSRVVVTGQQPGLFLGPLYTLYKAQSAVREAARRFESDRVPHVPVFWIAGEDHDWDESARLRFPPRGAEHKRELWVQGEGGGRALESIHVEPAEVDRLREQCVALAGGGPGAAEVQRLMDLLEPTDWLCERFFERQLIVLLGALFEGVALLPLPARLARPHAQRILQRELEEPSDPPALFQIGVDGRRTRPAGTPSGELSPDYRLRPVVQDHVLPVAAQIVGPGEAAYLAELDALYAKHGVAVPDRVPRRSAVLVQPKDRKLLDELGLDLAQALRSDAEPPAGEGLPPAVTQALEGVQSGLSEGIEKLRAAMDTHAAADPKAAARFEASVQGAIKKLSGRLERAADQRADNLQERWDAMRARLLPGGKPQERVYGLWSFLAALGPEALTAGDPA